MKGGFIVDEASWKRVELGLKNVAQKAPAHAARTLRRLVNRIVEKAKDYAPEDTAAMINSIEVQESRGPRNRLQLTILLGGSGTINVGGREIEVGKYAEIIHERYEEVVKTPGARTQEKMAHNPGKVGSHFLTRAAEEEKKTMNAAVIEAVKQVIKMEGLG